MNEKQFNTIVQMIAQLSERIEEVHTSLSQRIEEVNISLSKRIGEVRDHIDLLNRDFNSFKQQTQKNFRDQAAMLQEIATIYDASPASRVP